MANPKSTWRAWLHELRHWQNSAKSKFKTMLEADFATVPDSVMEIDVIFGGGDYVAMRARYMGTQKGKMGPFPASGKRVELPFVGILRFENNEIVEMWVEWDNLHSLTQLGHFPPKEEE